VKELREKAHVLGRICGRVGNVILFAMMLLMVTDIVLRFFFNKPILGGYELVEILMALLVGLGFAFTQSNDGHVRVTMFIDHLPPRPKAFIDGLGLLVGTAMMGTAGYAGILQGSISASQGQTTTVLFIPIYPFYYLLGVGFAVYALIMLVDALYEFSVAFRGPDREQAQA
jgi:TRAP-type C4-dicarboxylate transport system permease small subunit